MNVKRNSKICLSYYYRGFRRSRQKMNNENTAQTQKNTPS